MNELFYSEKKLNIKKILLVLFVAIFIIFCLFDLLSTSSDSKKEKIPDNKNPNQIFYDKDKSISIELSKQYELSSFTPSDDYLIEVRNSNLLDIFVSKKNKLENRSLSDIANSDSSVYIKNFSNYSNLSNVSEIKLTDTVAYTYCFHYLDTKTKIPFYLQVVWLQVGDYYYVFDIEFPLEYLENYSKIINETLNSFEIY